MIHLQYRTITTYVCGISYFGKVIYVCINTAWYYINTALLEM